VSEYCIAHLAQIHAAITPPFPLESGNHGGKLKGTIPRVMPAAERRVIAVHLQVAVTGWDDGPAAAAAGLTTIAHSLRERGEFCARSVVEPDRATVRSSPSWRLVIRESTRPADAPQARDLK
jgi:hypothetical protein